MKGIVKWFNDPKGYGFIKSLDNNQEYFVHFSDIEKTGFKSLIENTPVEFDIIKTEKGFRASNVKVLR